MEGVARDYQAKRIHGRTAATKSGYVSLEYRGRIIAQRRYSSSGNRRRIVEYWRECHIDFSEMAILIVPDSY